MNERKVRSHMASYSNGGRGSDLGWRVAKLETEVQHLNTTVDNVDRKTDSIIGMLGTRNKTDWQSMAAWCAVLLVLVGMWTAPMQDDLGEIKIAMEVARNERLKNVTEYAVLKEKVSVLGKYQAEIDGLLDRATALETHLVYIQKHMEEDGHPHDVLLAIANVKSELEAIKANRFTNASGSALEARIQSLENRLKGYQSD